ncbi:hypothetical protein M2432_002725 [Mycobacterium sp. OTB74]|nr:hypothetical protein [Mycobacterium sp. OTB74]
MRGAAHPAVRTIAPSKAQENKTVSCGKQSRGADRLSYE